MFAIHSRGSRSGRLLSSREPSAKSKAEVEARRILEESPLFRGRSHLLRIDECDGQLSLEGELPSYYFKQMLQTILRDVEGVRRIDNRVSVDWP